MLQIYMTLFYFMPWALKKPLKMVKTSVKDKRFSRYSGTVPILDFMVILSDTHVCIFLYWLYITKITVVFPTGASGLVHYDEYGERNLDYSVYDLQQTETVTKFVSVLDFDSHTKMIKYDQNITYVSITDIQHWNSDLMKNTCFADPHQGFLTLLGKTENLQ